MRRSITPQRIQQPIVTIPLLRCCGEAAIGPRQAFDCSNCTCACNVHGSFSFGHSAAASDKPLYHVEDEQGVVLAPMRAVPPEPNLPSRYIAKRIPVEVSETQCYCVLTEAWRQCFFCSAVDCVFESILLIEYRGDFAGLFHAYLPFEPP